MCLGVMTNKTKVSDLILSSLDKWYVFFYTVHLLENVLDKVLYGDNRNLLLIKELAFGSRPEITLLINKPKEET